MSEVSKIPPAMRGDIIGGKTSAAAELSSAAREAVNSGKPPPKQFSMKRAAPQRPARPPGSWAHDAALADELRRAHEGKGYPPPTQEEIDRFIADSDPPAPKPHKYSLRKFVPYMAQALAIQRPNSFAWRTPTSPKSHNDKPKQARRKALANTRRRREVERQRNRLRAPTHKRACRARRQC